MDSRLLWVFLGGAAGTAGRFWLMDWMLRALGAAFPYGTLLVNATGSFLLGALMQIGMSTDLLSPTARAALAIGVLGGFTTYSTFCYETLRYVQEGAWVTGLLYVSSMVLGCLVVCAAGFSLTRWLVGG